MSKEDDLAHCKLPTDTQSMCFNSVSQRFTAANVMNYTNRVINNIDIRTDTVRLSFVNTNGVDQNIEGATGTNWSNVFTSTQGVGIYPTVGTFTPKLATDWNIANVNVPVYNGDGDIVSVFAHIVLKQADNVQDANNIQLSLWTKKAATVAVPNPEYKMLYENASAPGTSSIMAIAIADRSDAINKTTTALTINVLIPIAKGDSIQARIRNAGANAVSYKYYQADLFCRPLILHGTDKNA